MKPSGYSTVSPYLIVLGAARVIEFACEAFDAEEIRRFSLGDGSIMHAELRIDDSVIMLGDAGGDWPPAPAHLHLYVPDVDSSFRRAIEAGGEVVREPAREGEQAERRGGVLDPGGNTWWIATAAD